MTLDRYIRIKELAQMLGIAKSTIYRLIKLNQFPQQIKLSERTAVWKLSLINEWISEREKQSH
jgi:prophage regulatory protein